MSSNIIFCDESGFTGNNLLDPDSRHFAYASIALEGSLARQLVTDIKKRFRLQGNELKGSNLVKHQRGRKAIEWLLEKCGVQSHLLVYNKRYALACKFHQWTFDEIFAGNNSLLYKVGFHRFISNALFLGLVANDPLAISVITEFQSLMSAKDSAVAVIQPMFSLGDDDGVLIGNFLESIVLFCRLHKDKILRETSPVLDELKWKLELSFSALHDSLCYWGAKVPGTDCPM